MFWKKKNKLENGHSKLDFAAIELANLVKIKGVVLPAEVEQVCSELNETQVSKVIKKLKKYRIEMVNGMLQYSKKVIGDAEMRDNELKAHLSRTDPPKITSDMMRLGTRFYEGVVATGFPKITKSDWLNRLSGEGENLDFSIFIVPEPMRNLEIYLQDQLKHVEAELYKLTQKNISSPELEKKKRTIVERLDNLAKGKHILFKLTLYALSKGVSEDQAKRTSNKIMTFLHSDGIEGKYATNYQAQIFNSVMPLGTDFLGGRQIIANSTTLAMSFPFRK